MPVTLKELDSLRAQLAADRETCANSELAQKYQDAAETKLAEVEAGWARLNPVDALDHVLNEIESNQIGKYSSGRDEIRDLAADIRGWQAALETIPTGNRKHPLFKSPKKL